jgi:hypothetical protein
VVLNPGVVLPEGTCVRLVVRSATKPPTKAASPLGEELLKLAGTVKGLPPDMALNHDHYLHGQAKK